MSEAIEGAEVMLFGVCEAYKESANWCVKDFLNFVAPFAHLEVRLEAVLAETTELLALLPETQPHGGSVRLTAATPADPADATALLQAQWMAGDDNGFAHVLFLLWRRA